MTTTTTGKTDATQESKCQSASSQQDIEARLERVRVLIEEQLKSAERHKQRVKETRYRARFFGLRTSV